MCWNIEGLKYKLGDRDFVNFLNQFDIFGLLESWSCDINEFRDVFNDYFCMFCPARKDKKFGRPMGGVVVYLKKYLNRLVKRLLPECKFGIFMQLDKDVFGTEKHIVLAFVYIPPQGSPFYKNEDLTGIELLEHSFLSLPVNLSDFHFILGGDFNARGGERLDYVKVDSNISTFQEYFDIFDCGDIPARKSCDKTVSSYGKDLLNFCKVYSMVILNGRCGSDLNGSVTYISAQGCSLIDYVLCSPDLLTYIIDFTIETRTESKHLPVCTHFKNCLVQNTATSENIQAYDSVSQNLIKYDFSGQNLEIFKQNLEKRFTNEQILTFSINIDDNTVSTDTLAKMFVSCLCNASVQYTVKSKRKLSEPWFDRECVALKKDKYKLLRKFRVSHSDDDRNTYIRARNSFKQACETKKSEYRARKLEQLISSVDDQKSFWSKLKKMTCKSTPAGKISNEEWKRHFESLFNEGADTEEANDDRFYEDLLMDDVQNEIFNSDITDEEVLKAVKSLKMGKSAGLDGVIPEMFLLGIQYLLPLLTRFFNRLFKTGDFPCSWGKSILVPLHKKGSIDSPDNYRGIVLQSVFSKVYTSVLNRRVTFYVNM
ncbi:MAG: endonuclease/exonuclease/phosphatase family protein [Candidatus Thiodiazotropha taylori]|nr:endonuclease/exonuclease/phosphatase family protein [Candidatus Thiodiazotropha taylori]MCW4334338.1 endonuclease/exonuclease/phosphatase family protein [Candidatus Thiodiazotropha endolucinida]